MKFLTAFVQTAIDNPHVKPVTLVDIELDGLTLRLCDRVFGDRGSECVFNGNHYDVLLLNKSGFNNGALSPMNYTRSSGKASITIDNTSPVGGFDRLSDLLQYYSVYFKKVTILETFEGFGNADEISFLWVVNRSDHTVSQIIISNGIEVVIPITGGGAYPSFVAYDDNDHIWIVNQYASTEDLEGAGTVTKINTLTGKIVATVTVGVQPRGIVFDGSYIWVANGGDDNIMKIDIDSNEVVATVDVGDSPYGLCFDGTYLWVSNYQDGTISKVDVDSNTVLDTVTVGQWASSYPAGMVYLGGYVWVALVGFPGNNVSWINVNTHAVDETGASTTLASSINSVVTTIPLTDASTFPETGYVKIDYELISYAGKSGNSLTGCVRGLTSYTPAGAGVPHTAGVAVTQTIYVAGNASDIASDGTYLWVSSIKNSFGRPATTEDYVAKIDPSSLTIIDTVVVGSSPRGLYFDGTYLWVANRLDNTISKIDVDANEVLDTIDAGTYPSGITGTVGTASISKFTGRVEDLTELNAPEITLSFAGIDLSLTDKFNHIIVDDTTYPGCDPDAVGKMLPQAYGQAKQVPFIPIDAGTITTLPSAITAIATTIVLSDSTKFPSSGTVQIDNEKITYTGNSSNQLTGCTRGTDGTTAAEHDAGAKVAEIQSYYYYIIGHAVKSIDTVYVDGIRQIGNYNAYTGLNGDDDPSGLYDGFACIRFNTLPTLVKQINVEVEDTIDVDTDTGLHDHTPAGGTTSPWVLDMAGVAAGYADELEKLIDNNFVTGCSFYQGTRVLVYKVLSESLGGTGPTSYRLIMSLEAAIVNPSVGLSFNLGGATTYLNNTTGPINYSQWTQYIGTWEQFSNLIGTVLSSAGWVGNIKPSIAVQVKYNAVGDASAATGVLATKTGTVTLTGNSVADTVIGVEVSADLQGFADDVSGTYTGTPWALIERPDYLFKHFQIDRCGVPTSLIHVVSYAASGVSYAANSYALAPVFLSPPNVPNVLHELAMQAKSLEFWEADGHHLVFWPNSPASVKTVDRIDLDSISIRFGSRADIMNKLSATFDKKWSGYNTAVDPAEANQDIVKAQSASSITKFDKIEQSFLFDFIGDAEAQAQDVIDWILSRREDVPLLLDFAGGYELSELQKGDVIDFVFDDDSLMDKALLGFITSENTKMRVLGLEYQDDQTFVKTESISLGPIVASPQGGSYHEAQSVTLVCSIVGVSIYYTTDGSTPDAGSTPYTGAIEISCSLTLNAIAIKDGWE